MKRSIVKQTGYAGIFIAGVFITSAFFMGYISGIEIIEENDQKTLTGGIICADAADYEEYGLMCNGGDLSSTIEDISLSGTTTASTSIATIHEEEEKEETVIVKPQPKSKTVSTSKIKEIISSVENQLAKLQTSSSEEDTTEEERVLPEGVYQLANGDYVDATGAKISGDPFAYNYKPPQKEEYFTTPGGVVMDRFGNIISSPEVIDESLVLIPATIIDLDNPPSTVSPIYIPRYVLLAISQNPLLTCIQIQLYNNDRALCELYKERGDDYTWIRVDEEE